MKLDHIVLLVSDLEASLPFYDVLLGLLGFDKDRDNIYGNDDGIYFDIKPASDPDHGYQRYAPGLNHIGFTAPDIAAIIAIQSKMAEAGFDVPAIQNLGDAKALFLKDPDGMRIELTVYS